VNITIKQFRITTVVALRYVVFTAIMTHIACFVVGRRNAPGQVVFRETDGVLVPKISNITI
jgi:hypothetical protein